MNRKKIIILISGALLTGLLCGCTPTKHRLIMEYITTDSAPVPSINENAQNELAEAAVSVGQSLQKLAAIELANHPHVQLPAPMNPKMIGMAQSVSINWTGPVQSLLQHIAKISHYQFRVLGVRPAIPALVSIQAQNKPLLDILRDARYQVIKKARVSVYPSTRVIELRYIPS